MFVKKSLTLIELLISMLLFSIVIMGVFGIYNASSNFFTSSKTKSEVLNDLTYVLDHLDKSVYRATGCVDNPAITVTNLGAGRYEVGINRELNNPPTPIDFNDDTTIYYIFNPTGPVYNFSATVTVNAHEVVFVDGGGTDHLLTKKLIDPNVLAINDPTTNDGVLTIDNLCLRRDPSEPYDAKTNPEICITGQKFSTLMQSLN